MKSDKKRPDSSHPPPITILIPVFNSAHYLHDLFFSLVENTSVSLLQEIIIGDDGSDEVTKHVIAHFVQTAPFPVRVITHHKNIGYLLNANQLYKEVQSEIVIFLNTDTLVPSQWLERIYAAFRSDDNIALATPFSTNATFLTIKPQEGQTFWDVDDCLQTLTPHYPDAHTAIGFCLGIRKKHIDKPDIFNEKYQFGYYEETDLHYEILAKGLRSVVVDNLFIYHSSMHPSFGLKCNPFKLGKLNQSTFMQKWGTAHKKNEDKYWQKRPYSAYRKDNNFYFNYLQFEQSIDVLFVLPTLVDGIGGVDIVTELAKWLNLNHIRSHIFCYGYVNSEIDKTLLINPWQDKGKLFQQVLNVKMIFATSYDSFIHAKTLADHYKTQLNYFVQGPELMFSAGKFYRQIIHDYQQADQIFTVSNFLSTYLKNIDRNKINQLDLGANSYVFYPPPPQHALLRKKHTIAACLRNNETKGNGILIYLLALAKKAGFEIHLFGKDTHEFDLIHCFHYSHGNLSPTELRKLFWQVEFYLDCSYFEGLGLLPLEAAACGAIPILFRNGGANELFKDKINAFFLHEAVTDLKFFDNLYQVNQKTLADMRTALMSIDKNFSLEKAKSQFLSILYVLYPALQKQPEARGMPLLKSAVGLKTFIIVNLKKNPIRRLKSKLRAIIVKYVKLFLLVIIRLKNQEFEKKITALQRKFDAEISQLKVNLEELKDSFANQQNFNKAPTKTITTTTTDNKEVEYSDPDV